MPTISKQDTEPQAVAEPLAVTIRFDGETSDMIRRAVAIFKARHQDMNPTQLARDGARKWAAEVIASEPAA